jgi:ankyrin repeat protein
LFKLRDDKGNTFLHSAVYEELPELVQYLLDKGVDPNIPNADGDTCLHFAMRTNNQELIYILIEQGALIYVKNSKRETPVDVASVSLSYKY